MSSDKERILPPPPPLQHIYFQTVKKGEEKEKQKKKAVVCLSKTVEHPRQTQQIRRSARFNPGKNPPAIPTLTPAAAAPAISGRQDRSGNGPTCEQPRPPHPHINFSELPVLSHTPAIEAKGKSKSKSRSPGRAATSPRPSPGAGPSTADQGKSKAQGPSVQSVRQQIAELQRWLKENAAEGDTVYKREKKLKEEWEEEELGQQQRRKGRKEKLEDKAASLMSGAVRLGVTPKTIKDCDDHDGGADPDDEDELSALLL